MPNQTYRNNIVSGNTVGVEYEFGTEANNPVFQNNIVFGNDTDYVEVVDPTGTAGNVSVDPLFADDLAGDYRLLPTSPAIDTALEDPDLTRDILGLLRPIDGDGDMTAVSDRGAFEAAPPVANAGLNQTVNVDDAVVLDATGSNDPDGMIAEFLWTQIGGLAVTLNDVTSATPSFTAPGVGSNLAFRLTVTDDLGFVTTDEVAVTVAAPPPPARRSSGGSVGLYLLSVLFLLRSARRRLRTAALS